jgi:GDP-4-dehydro-6-deoxy-D-mannose reductase
MLDILLGHSSKSIEKRVDPNRLRPSDVKLLWGDSSKFRAATGWAPTIPFPKTMEDLLNYWRQRLRRQR